MDQIIYSPQLHCSAARVMQAGDSDHFPIEAVFGFEPKWAATLEKI
jgi:hypothetical protein